MREKGSVVIAVFIAFLTFTSVASAVVFVDDQKIEVEGVLYNQNIWRDRNFSHHNDFIEGMNQFDLRLVFHAAGEKGYVKKLGFIDGIDFRFIGRGVYDYAYDVTDNWGASGGFFSKDFEKSIKKDVDLREAYADIFMGPLSLRLGKQQVVWGKTDFFRLLDIINPLDYSWHFFFESFDDIRIPQIMGKALLALPNIGPFSDVSLEFDANPRDFNSTDLGRYGMPWALAPNGFNLIPKFRPNDWQLGGRIQARLGGFSFTINDYYTFQQDPVFNLVKGGLTYPRMNIFGGAVDYYDNFTKSVLRLEAVYAHDKSMGVDFTNPKALEFLGKHPNGVAKKDEIKYCIGIDRPTMIRILNPYSAFFLSGQLFMTHVLKHEDAITDDGVNTKKSGHGITTLMANTTYINGRLTPQIYWAWDVQSKNSHVVGPSLAYLFSNYFNVKVGANLFWGSKTARYTYFGAYEDFDELYVKFQFNF